MAYSLATAVFLVPLGKLADIHGRKRAYALGLIIYTVASCLCAMSPSASALIASRVGQGLGSAMIFGTGIAILSSVYPVEQRGHVLGINTAVVYAGLSAGPFLGGLLVGQWGWRSAFWVNLPLGTAALLFIVWRVRGEWQGSPDDPFDLTGSLIYGGAIIAVMYGLSLLPRLWGAWLLILGLLFGAVFVGQERRAPSPVLDLSLFRGNRVFTLSGVAAMLNYWATSSVTFLLSLYLQYIQGMTPQRAGLILVAQPIVMAVLSPMAGRLSDRHEPRLVASAGMGLTVLGLALLALLGERTALVHVLVALVVLGTGFALFSSPNTSALMGSVARRHYGMASGLVGTMRLFGQMLSMGVTMLLFSLYMGQAQITPAYHGRFLSSARTGFALSAVLCSLGVLASLARGRMHAQVERPTH